MSDPLETLTLRHVLERSARLFSDRPALSNLGDTPITYKELNESVQALSLQLQNYGIGFGDAVVILAENCPQWGIAYLAITTMGAVAVPVLIEFHADAVAHIIRHSESKAVFVSERLFPKVADANFDPAPLFINLETFSPIEQGIAGDKLRDLKSAGLREVRRLREKMMRFAHKAPQELKEDDLAAIIYTSGTTGHSKGVMLSHANIISNALSVRRMADLKEHDRMLSILPLPHTFECTLGFVLPILRGVHIHYLDKPPTGRVLLPALAQVKPTAMATVPLVMEKIYKTNVLPKLTGNRLLKKLYSIPFCRKLMHKAVGKKLKAIFGGELWIVAIGGAPLAIDAERFLQEAEFPYAVGYGLTEASPMLSGSSPAETRLCAAGKAIEKVELRVADTNPLTGEGEIQAKGPGIMKGYYKAPEITAEVFTADGWFRTGDLGYIKDGYVYIRGRLKNMILGPSGENIYPEEIESVFFNSPYVSEVLVYQAAGRLTARVFLDDTKLDESFSDLPAEEMMEKRKELLEELRLAVNSKVSTFARILRIIDQTEPFEKTPTHKIKRYLYVE